MPQEEREQPSQPIPALDLADLVAHEVNNLLNSVVLHAALLERSLPPEARPAVQSEIAVVREAVTRAGTMLQRWQQMVPKPAVALEALDLNRVLHDLPVPRELTNPSGAAVSVHLSPAADLPPVLGNRADLGRLVPLLLASAAAVSPAGSTITVRTEADQGHVQLSVEDQGPAIEADLLDRAFEPFASVRGTPLAASDMDELRLAACKVLARRQKGVITAANRPEGGVVISVRFTAAPAG
jgi:signal transduction histidine kinase